MGRAEQAQVRKQGNTLFGQEDPNAQAAGQAALSGFQSLYANPGYTPAQQTAITQATEGGIGAAQGAAQQRLANSAARTRNSAGLTANEDELSREALRTGAAAGAQNQETFANAARADRNLALGGFQSLYGTSLGGANNTLGILNNSANQKNAFTDSFQSALGKSLGSIGGSFSGPGGSSFGFG